MQAGQGAEIGRRRFLAGGLSTGATMLLSSALVLPGHAAPARPRISGIIDVHAHPIPESWKAWLTARFAPAPPRFEGRDIPAWSVDAAIEAMDANGVQAMVLSAPVGAEDMASPEAPALARRINEELAAIVARHPRRFGAFATLPLVDIDASIAEIRHALDMLHFDGVAIPTSFQGAYPGEPRFEPILAELNRRKATVFAHPRSPVYIDRIGLKVPPGMLEFVFDSTRAVVSLVSSGMRLRYPDFRYIATHAGGTVPFLADRIGFGSARTDYPVKLTYEQVMEGIRSFHYDLALTTARPALLALREVIPVDHILPGFDYAFAPAARIGPSIAALIASGVFSEAELTRIATRNPLALLPALAGRLA